MSGGRDGALGGPAYERERQKNEHETEKGNEKAFHREPTLTRANAARAKNDRAMNPAMPARIVCIDIAHLRNEAILLCTLSYTAAPQKCPIRLLIRNAFCRESGPIDYGVGTFIIEKGGIRSLTRNASLSMSAPFDYVLETLSRKWPQPWEAAQRIFSGRMAPSGRPVSA